MLKIFSSSKADVADTHYSSILKRRMPLWQSPASIKDRKVREEIERLRFYNTKANAYEFVKGLGIPCPKFTQYPSIKAAMQATTDARFVVKPAAGHSSYGVYLLERQPDGSLLCHMTQKHFKDSKQLAAAYEAALATAPKFAMSEAVIIEELMTDVQGFAVPLDYKVYAFYTGAAMVMQKYGPTHVPKNQWIFEFYDAQGTPLGKIRDEQPGTRELTLKPPPDFTELIKTADTLVKAMSVSFVRIDLYMTPKGVYFGEFTPLPNLGKKAFYDEQEAILGQHWMQSLKALGLDYPKPSAE